MPYSAASELARLEQLAAYAILDTPPEEEFDHLVQLTARIFSVPIALVTLVDRDRQFFKARVGVPVCETGREGSFCQFAMTGSDVFVVLDATKDKRFADNPGVIGEPYVRFYAGAPLRTPSGHSLGALCIVDSQCRSEFSVKERQSLQDLAHLVMEKMELRRLSQASKASRSQFQNIAATSPDGIVCASGQNIITSWNTAAVEMFGYTVDEAVGQSLELIVPQAMRAAHSRGLNRVASGGAPRIIGQSLTLSACRKDGTEFPIELSLSQWSENGSSCFGAIIRDITVRKQDEARLQYAASFDHLTGLANRLSLQKQLDRICGDGRHATVLLLDLDEFKDVNDTLGHAAGDRVLVTVAKRLRECVDITQMVARLGGDEFVVLLGDVADPLQASGLSELLIAAIEKPISLDGHLVRISASIGVAVSSERDTNFERLLGNADLALYRAKSAGRGRASTFTQDLRQSALAKGALREDLRDAWDERAFELYYQPQVDLRDGTLTGAEALIRWNYPYQGVLSPGVFLPTLESDTLAVPVGEWIIRTACEQAVAWRKRGQPTFRIGVNLFAVQLRNNDLVEIVGRALSDFDLPPQALELEITENIILGTDKTIVRQLETLRSMSVGIAFDDFGTGFASLSMLRDFPISRLKIDRSFITDISRSSQDQAITKALVEMAGALDLNVIAEGIEREDQHDIVCQQGCSEGQGYLYGRPVTAAMFEQVHIAQPSRTLVSAA